MKTSSFRFILRFLALASALLMAGCADMATNNTVGLLSTAGFVSRTPENARQKELYDQLPANQLHRATYQGRVIYAYKDPAKGVAYVGNDAAYQRYQRLATEQRVVQEYRMAEMNQSSATGWYGAYGPYVGYRPVVVHRH